MLMLSTRVALCAAAIGLPFVLTVGHAATADGKFAIEGAGRATCSAFVEARKERSDAAAKAAANSGAFKSSIADDTTVAGADAYARFIGWIEGYVTASNRYLGDTYDIAPWQTPEFYGIIVGQHCEANPQEHLFSVVEKIVISLSADRLKEPSEMVSLRVRNRAMVVYTEVIRRAQDALKKQNMYQGEVNGRWDQATQLGFANYQAAIGLQDTGLPDPVTLWVLFSPQVTQVDAIAKARAASKTAK